MTSRERVIKAIEFKSPDYVPVMHAVLPAGWYAHGDNLRRLLSRYPRHLAGTGGRSTGPAAAGYKYESSLKSQWSIVDDFSYMEPRSFQFGTPGEQGFSTDEWNCEWEKLDPGIVGQVIGHPLDDWSKWGSYRIPDPLAYWRWNETEIKETVRSGREAGKYVIAYGGNLFELAQWLRGYENLMTDIMLEPGRVEAITGMITDYLIATTEKWLQYDIDAVAFNDDWGTQTSLMIPPEKWRDLFKPYYARLFEMIKAKGRHVHFHTDGCTIEIIPELIDIGVDVLNPQLSAMNLDELGQVVRGNVCIRTDIDRQYILTRATPQEVDQYVRTVFEKLGTPRGGIIACGEINSDSRIENIEAMYEAFEKYQHLVSTKPQLSHTFM